MALGFGFLPSAICHQLRANLPDIYVARSASRKTKKPAKGWSASGGKKKLKPERLRRKENALLAVRRIGSHSLRPSKSPLAAFAAFPAKVGFETQEKEEPIVLLLRRHWIVNLPWVFLTILMILSPFTLSFIPILAFLPSRFQLIFVILWYLFTLSFIFEKFLGWFFNVFIVTDERVVDVDFYSLTYKQISEAGLDRIQDITYRTGGVIRSIFDFGDVLIQTAGEVPNIEFEDVPYPAQVVRILNELIVQEQQEMLNGRAR